MDYAKYYAEKAARIAAGKPKYERDPATESMAPLEIYRKAKAERVAQGLPKHVDMIGGADPAVEEAAQPVEAAPVEAAPVDANPEPEAQ